MKTFDWDQNFATGIDEVDDQHRFLVELINQLGQAMATQGAEDDAPLL